MTKVKRTILWVLGAVIVCLLLMYAVFLTNSRGQIEKELEKIRAAGYPTNCVELDGWYKAVPDEENGALVVLEAIDQMVNWESKKTPFDRAASAEMAELGKAYGFKDIKISETLSEDFPEDWQVKNQSLLPLINYKIKLPIGTESMSEQMKGVISDYIADNAETLETLHTTPNYSKSRYLVDMSAGFNVLLPYLGNVRKCVRMLSLETVLHCENNRPDEAVESFKAAIAVGRTLRDEPILISYLVKIACDGIAIKSLEYMLNHTKFNSDQLKTIEQMLKDSTDNTGIKRALIGERCFGLSFFEDPSALNTGPGTGGGLAIGIKALRVTGLQNKDVLAYLDLMGRQIDAVGNTAAEREAIFKQAESDIDDLPWYCISTKMTMPALSKCISLHYRNQAFVNLGRTAAGIERYRLDNDNKLPDELSELVPGYIEKVPIDPFDQKPIKYIRQENGYILYSVGDDMTDNGGKELDDKGRRFRDGTDIVFTVERSEE